MAEGIGIHCKLGVERDCWGSIVRGDPRGCLLDLEVNREGVARARRKGGQIYIVLSTVLEKGMAGIKVVQVSVYAFWK